MSWDVQKPKLDLSSLPDNWDGFTNEQRVQRGLDVIQEELKRVRMGEFDATDGERAAAFVLECQLNLAEFYTEAEANSRNAKHMAEFAEADVANNIAKTSEKKLSEMAIKRKAIASYDVKEAKEKVIDLDRNYKKWRCIYEILREAHITFRNISKL